MVVVSIPTLRVEGRYFADGCLAVGGVDEVGRGAWAGPVSVGVAVVTPGSGRRLPRGVRDSKQLTWAEREALFDPSRVPSPVGPSGTPATRSVTPSA